MKMTEPRSKWQTEELATTFLYDTRGEMPGADLQPAVTSKLKDLKLSRNLAGTILS